MVVCVVMTGGLVVGRVVVLGVDVLYLDVVVGPVIGVVNGGGVSCPPLISHVKHAFLQFNGIQRGLIIHSPVLAHLSQAVSLV